MNTTGFSKDVELEPGVNTVLAQQFGSFFLQKLDPNTD